jgi:hypothetical protein
MGELKDSVVVVCGESVGGFDESSNFSLFSTCEINARQEKDKTELRICARKQMRERETERERGEVDGVPV